MTDRLTRALAWLAEQFSATADEFRKANHPGGDMLLTAAVTGGWVNSLAGRYAVSEQGRRRLKALAPAEGES